MNFTIPLLTIGNQANVGKRISVVIHKKRKGETLNNDNDDTDYRKRKRSRAWDYFSIDPVDPSRGICKICQEPVGCNNQTTTPLIRHLEIVHFIIIDTITKHYKTLQNQANVFSGIANIYSPTYRQMHYHGYSDNSNGIKAFDVAYSDIENAFKHYLKYFNNIISPLGGSSEF